MSAMNEEKENHWGIVMVALMSSMICIGITVQVEYMENMGEKRLPPSNIQEQKKKEDIESDIQKDVRKIGDTETEKMPEARKANSEIELVFAYQENENIIMEKRDMINFRNKCLVAEGYAIVLSDGHE